VLEDIEIAKMAARDKLDDRKKEMVSKANKNIIDPQFGIGVIVYMYTPATTPGLSRKLTRPWIGPLYIVEKPSSVHVRLRRNCDGKLIKTRID